MLVTDDQVRTALQVATASLQPAPALLPQVHQRIRRTAIRRRCERIGGASVVIALAAISVAVLRPPHVPQVAAAAAPLPQRYQAVLDRPTGGDLASGAARTSVLTAYSAWVDGPAEANYVDGPGGRLAGEPNVVWMGSTPAGAAAITVQELQPPTASSGAGPAQTTGLYVTYFGAVSTEGWHVVGDGTFGAEWQDLGGVLMGPDPQVLVALDTGAPMRYATMATIEPNGYVERNFQSVPFSDGAAVIPLPAGTKPDQVVVQPTDRSQPNTVVMRPAGTGQDGPRTTLPWEGAYSFTPGVSPPPADTLAMRFEDALRRDGFTDPNGTTGAPSGWFAYGLLSDGAEVVVGEYQLGDGVARLYAVVFAGARSEVIPAGRADPAAALPVRVNLGAGRGRVLVRVGAAISWRRADRTGPPDGTARDTALLPARIAMAVLVRVGNDAPQALTLPPG